MALRNEVQESLTDTVLELIVNNYKLENSYEKVISSEGYIEDIITSGSIDNRRVLYEEDYQYKDDMIKLVNSYLSHMQIIDTDEPTYVK